MKFCSNCGRHYKDTDNFCKECGIELKQGAEDSSSFSELKDSASQALSEAGNKAKEALSEENRQKIQQKASAAADSLKHMDTEKGKQMLNQGVSRFHALSANIKKIIAAAMIFVIAFGAMSTFLPKDRSHVLSTTASKSCRKSSARRQMNSPIVISRNLPLSIQSRNGQLSLKSWKKRVIMPRCIPMQRMPRMNSFSVSVPTCSQASKSNPSRFTAIALPLSSSIRTALASARSQ